MVITDEPVPPTAVPTSSWW